MPLPDGFSSSEHLQDTVMRLLNKRVSRHFRDVHNDETSGAWNPNLDSDRARLRVACTHLESDSMMETLTRLQLFLLEIGAGYDNLAIVYGLPAEEYHKVKFVPNVVFKFQESVAIAKQKKRQPVRKQIAVRLVNESHKTITESKITQWSNDIKRLFPRNFVYKTGRLKASYRDPENGLRCILSPYSIPEAKEVLTKVMDFANITPDWSLLTESKITNKNFDKDEFVTILGKRKKLPAKRPVADTYLVRVDLKIHGRLEDVCLYTRFR